MNCQLSSLGRSDPLQVCSTDTQRFCFKTPTDLLCQFMSPHVLFLRQGQGRKNAFRKTSCICWAICAWGLLSEMGLPFFYVFFVQKVSTKQTFLIFVWKCQDSFVFQTVDRCFHRYIHRLTEVVRPTNAVFGGLRVIAGALLRSLRGMRPYSLNKTRRRAQSAICPLSTVISDGMTRVFVSQLIFLLYDKEPD